MMSTNNPLSDHTDGTNDGLTDGSHILSPSVTNLYEGVHGNGILLPHDTAYGDSDRNDPPDLPGAISAGSNVYSFVVKACDVILDGVLYAIGGGSDITVTLSTTTSQKLGTFTALTSGQECLFVVIATPDGVKVAQTDRITTAAGAYPSISGTAASYLKTGSGSGDNRQTVVLGTVRATFNGSAVSANDLDLTISERNDKRVFVRPSPFYLSPVRDGTISSTTGINGHTALSTVHTGQAGNFGDNGIIWQSFNSANKSMLYYSRKDSSNRHTHLLGPTNINVSSPSSNLTFTFDSDQVFVLTASTTINLNPSGTFPPGHTVFVSVPSGSTVTFDSSGLNQAISAGNALMFAYDGTNWKRVLFSSTVSTTASGASGLVQLSDGAGGFTSDTALSFNTGTNTLTVDGKLTVTGLIDPTGLVVDEKADTAATGHTSAAGKGLYWVKNETPNRPMFTNDANAEKKVIIEGDNISELTNDSAFVDAAGAAAAAPATNLTYTASTRVLASSTGTNATLTEVVAGGNSGLMTGAQATKLDGIETSATADQTDAEIRAAVEAATDSNVFTDADHTKLNGIEASADVTDATNVAAAGAIMDGDFTSNGLMKRTGAGTYDSVTVTSAGEALLDDADADAQRDTLGIIAQKVGADQSNDLATGWWTIAYIEGRDSSGAYEQRGYADFLVRDNQVSRHQAVRFAAGHHFGSDVSATLNLFNNTAYSTSEPIIGLRIKEAGIYAGAALQIEVGQSTNSLRCFAHFNEQNDGWILLSTWLQDSDNSGHDAILGYSTDSWTNFTVKSYIDLQHDALDASKKGGIATVGGLTVSANKGGSTFNPVFQVENAETVINDTGYSDHDFRVESDTQTHMLFVDAGNDHVGIGTDSPDAPLHIQGSANDEVVLHITTVGGTSGSVQGKAQIGMSHFNTDTVPSATITVEEIDVSDHRANMTFTTRASASSNATPTEKMRITYDGKVGIGNTSPAQKLHVTGTIRQTAVTSAVLVADANGDLTAATNLSDQSYLTTAQTDVFTPVTSAPSWAAPPPATIQDAIDRLAAFVVTIPGAPAQIP